MKIFTKYIAIAAALLMALPAQADLFIVGDTWGWSLTGSPAMQRMNTEEEEYVWSGWIEPGEVKFNTTTADWNHGLVSADGYQDGITLGRAYQLTGFSGGANDNKFKVHEAAFYDVHVNVARKTVVFSHPLYFIGNSRLSAFNQGEGLRMTPVGDELYRLTVPFEAGTASYFGFARHCNATGDRWYEYRYAPSTGKYQVLEDGATVPLVYYESDVNDTFTADGGVWTITVDMKNMTATFHRGELSALGHLNDNNGWDTGALTGLHSVGDGLHTATTNVTGSGYFFLTRGAGSWADVNASRISPLGDVSFEASGTWQPESGEAIRRPASNVRSNVWIHTADLWTDRAVYRPGESVWIQFARFADYPDAIVRYRHHADVLLEHPLKQEWWEWTPPTTDFTGYLVDVYTRESDGAENIIATIGVDVSSTWTRFPRNGYTAWYEPGKEQYIAGDVAFLARRHINVVQFQDWHWRHHRPYCPDEQYTDIANRPISKNVVREFINTMHGYNMQTLFYNLCYGALGQDGAASDGVQEAWYMFTNTGHGKKDYHDLYSIGWKSNIDLVNPGNTDWQNYMADRVKEVYDNLGFDGYQVDQLGPHGTHYDYWSNRIDERDGYAPFLKKMKERFPEKHLVMNAVSDFGGDKITGSGVVSACYTELWAGKDKFRDIYWNIFDNNMRSGNSLRTIFAAYMNYDYGRANAGKTFNTPGVLLTDACIFALGGAHLELGTGGNMLCNEYFPNTNLKLDEKLQDAITHYYDFATAYENLLDDCRLFDNKVEREVAVESPSHSVAMWTYRHGPAPRRLNVLARQAASGKKVFHLLNFSSVNDLSWRDLDGTQPDPKWLNNVVLTIDSEEKVNRVWVASPDLHGGAPVDVEFTQNGRLLTLTVPLVHYWSMLVFE